MARGGKIVVNADAKGAREWGYLAGAYKPGTILQVDATVALKHGKHTWKVFTRNADGDRPLGPHAVLDFDPYEARDAATAYASGDFAKLYIPLPGDELNLLFGDQAGTADDVAAGITNLIVDNGTGKVIPTTGSPQDEVAVALESIVDPVADQLLWCRWKG